MEYHLSTPVKEKDIRKLRKGDVVYISGIIVTARDEAHLKALELEKEGEQIPVDFKGLGVFHCGPIMTKQNDKWKTVAAGPTTSARMEIFEDMFIKAFRPAVIIGKGGMGNRTVEACKEFGCVYGIFTGGAALLAANGIEEVQNVFWLEDLGMPECLWVYKVKDFGPLIVSIDTHGNNLTAEVAEKVDSNLKALLGDNNDA